MGSEGTNEKHGRYPVVLRFEGLRPEQLARFEMHRLRAGGDVGHTDPARRHRNRLLIGPEDWASHVLAEIDEMRMENHADDLDALRTRRRTSELKRRIAEGPKDPWRPSKHGPMRELILTAHHAWFDGFEEVDGDIDFHARERAFEARALEWLNEHFGTDVVHARADRDEGAYHIHAVILPRATVTTGGKTRRMLQPSIHPLIADYEAAQDSVGAWFAPIGLCRGEKRARAVREALNDGRTPPPPRRHVRPAAWRRAEEQRLAEEAAKVERGRRDVAARQEEADDIIEVADAIADGRLDENTRPVVPAPSASTSKDRAVAGPVGDPAARTRPGAVKARKTFRAALRRLSRHARDEAGRRYEAAFEEIGRADDAIVAAATLLPPQAREAVARVRRSLTARIVAIPRTVGRNAPRRPDGDPRSKKNRSGPEA